jgi:predicted GIY-YIG superfamily endonuclease
VPFVYILRCGDGTLYTGAAKDLARRLQQHRLGIASKYTRGRLPVIVVWKRRLPDWSRVLKEEYRIKSLSRARKERLFDRRARALGRRQSRGIGRPRARRG